MQTPAPFDYERATSVDGAIASLQRLGPEARVIAGGHSLLPMMKLRLANPAHLIDINDLHELSYIRERRRRAPDRRADAPRRPAEVGAARRALSGVPRRREGDRRPGRPQPRHDRRLALPGGRRRGPVGRVHGGQGAGGDPRRRRRARRRHGRVPRRPVHDRRRRRRAAHRDADPAARRRRQRPREGRAPRRRLGDRRGVGGGLDRGRPDRRRGHRAQRRRADDDPSLARRRAAARPGARRTSCSRRQARSPRRTAPRRRTAAGRSTTSAISPASSPHVPSTRAAARAQGQEA